MTYRRCGRSGLQASRPSRSGCGTTSATTGRSRRSARSCAARSTSASPTSTWPTTTGRRTGRRRRTSAASWPTDLRALPRRAGHLHQGRLRHVARARTATGARASTCWPASTRACADGPRLRRHLLLAPVRPGDAARGDDGRAGHAPCARARRCTRASRPTRPSGPREAARDPARPGHAAAHPPAVLLDAQPLDRGRTARRARRRGHRLHRVLAAGPGAAHRPLPGRRPRGLARAPGRLAVAATSSPREPRARPRAERDRRAGAARPWPSSRSRGRCATSG